MPPMAYWERQGVLSQKHARTRLRACHPASSSWDSFSQVPCYHVAGRCQDGVKTSPAWWLCWGELSPLCALEQSPQQGDFVAQVTVSVAPFDSCLFLIWSSIQDHTLSVGHTLSLPFISLHITIEFYLLIPFAWYLLDFCLFFFLLSFLITFG